MKQREKEKKMDNSYVGVDYSLFTGAVSKKTRDFNFEEEVVEYEPTEMLLSSIIKAMKDRSKGKASPIFPTTSEMKKWFDEQDE